MEWDEKLQQIIDYIENHLQRKEEPINIDVLLDFFKKYFLI